LCVLKNFNKCGVELKQKIKSTDIPTLPYPREDDMAYMGKDIHSTVAMDVKFLLEDTLRCPCMDPSTRALCRGE